MVLKAAPSAVALVFIVSQAPPRGGDTPASVTETFAGDVGVHLEASRPEFTQLEPVKLTVVLTNRSDKPYEHSGELPRHALFEFRVNRGDRPAQHTGYYQRAREATISVGREWVALGRHNGFARRSICIPIYSTT